jgi:hypothetical protein
METWMQILSAGMMIAMLFFIWPGVKASIARSKQAEEKHWGTAIAIALILIAFIALLIASVR